MAWSEAVEAMEGVLETFRREEAAPLFFWSSEIGFQVFCGFGGLRGFKGLCGVFGLTGLLRRISRLSLGFTTAFLWFYTGSRSHEGLVNVEGFLARRDRALGFGVQWFGFVGGVSV